MHTDMHRQIHKHTYIHRQRHTYKHIQIETYIHTYKHTYIQHTHIETYIHTYIHRQRHIYIQTYHLSIRRVTLTPHQRGRSVSLPFRRRCPPQAKTSEGSHMASTGLRWYPFYASTSPLASHQQTPKVGWSTAPAKVLQKFLKEIRFRSQNAKLINKN